MKSRIWIIIALLIFLRFYGCSYLFVNGNNHVRTLSNGNVKYWHIHKEGSLLFEGKVAFRTDGKFCYYRDLPDLSGRYAYMVDDIGYSCDLLSLRVSDSTLDGASLKWKIIELRPDTLKFIRAHDSALIICVPSHDQKTRIVVPYCKDTLF